MQLPLILFIIIIIIIIINNIMIGGVAGMRAAMGDRD